MESRLTDKEVMRLSLVWAMESIDAMISGFSKTNGSDDQFQKETKHLRNRMAAVEKKYFGTKPNPFKDAKLIPIHKISEMVASGEIIPCNARPNKPRRDTPA